MNSIIIRVQNQTGSFFDFTVGQGTELKTTISAIENGDIGELFGAGTQEFILVPTNQTDEDGIKSGNTVEDFFGNLDLAGASSKVDITHYYPASVMNDGIELFRGKLYFKSVLTDNKGNNQYKVVIINQTVALKQELQKMTIASLDFSQYNHALTVQQITASWDDQLFNGDIKYPSVNYGMNVNDPACPQYAFYGGSSLPANTKKSNTFDNYRKPLRPIDFKPAIRAKAVVDTIFSGSSFTYTSSFFDSAYFNDVYILSTATNTLGPVSEFPQASWVTAELSQSTAIFNPGPGGYIVFDEIINNQGGYFDTLTGTYAVPETGWYTIQGNIFWYHRNANLVGALDPLFYVNVWKNNTTNLLSWRKQGQIPTGSLPFSTTQYLTGGDTIRIGGQYQDTQPGTTRYIELINRTNWGGKFSTTHPSWVKIFSNQGAASTPTQTVLMGKQFPASMTGYDIMKGLAQKFNLVFEPDVDNPKVIKIEPFQDWMNQGANIDWTNKVDMSQKFEITHPAFEQPKRIVFSDVDDNDFYNKDAKSKNPFEFNFGTYVFQADNDISQGEKKIGATFAPTPVAGIPNGPNYIVPHLCAQDDNGQQTPIQFKPRLLFDGGKKVVPSEAKGIDDNGNINPGNYWLLDQSTNLPILMSNFYQMSTMTSLPVDFYGGKDLHFSGFYWVPYVTAPINSQTPFGAYLNHWGSYLNGIYDDDARKLVCNVYLTPTELATLKLNSKYFIMGNYWRINKLSNANLNRPSVVEVELLKVPTRITTEPSRRTTPSTGPNDPAAMPPVRISNYLRDGTVTYENAITGDPITSASLLEIAAPKDGFIVSGSTVSYQIDTLLPNTTQIFAQRIMGSNVVNNESNRTNVMGGLNEIKGELDNLLLVGDENVVYENSSGISILNSSANLVGENAGSSNLTIINGDANQILSTVSTDYNSSIQTNNVVLINVSGSIIDSSTNTNFIGRFNATENLAPNKVSSIYTDFTTLPEYYGMNVMASTGLEEAYWFNAKPYIINGSASMTTNLNTKQGRNKYVFYVKHDGSNGGQGINLDDIDGAGNNFPSQGRSLIFYTDENCSPSSQVVITAGGSDTFKPSYLGSSNYILLDEPWQVCEIHAVYDTAVSQAWWQVIRRTTEQRRNSYLQSIATSKQCSTEETKCFSIAFDNNPFSYGVEQVSATEFKFPYLGKWNVNFSCTAFSATNNENLTIALALNGVEIPNTAITTHTHVKEKYYSLSHHWIVNITDPVNDRLEVKFHSTAVGTCIEAGTHEEGCHSWPVAAVNISYAGGGYGIDA